MRKEREENGEKVIERWMIEHWVRYCEIADVSERSLDREERSFL